LCASAPALKVFFKRYFTGSSSTYGGYSRSGSTNQTPIKLRSRGKGLSSGYSTNASHADHSGIHDPAPFQGIKVSQGLDVHVEDRDDMSRKSDDSTKNLTTLPRSENSNVGREWIQPAGGCQTVCTAFDPNSRDSSMNRGHDRDVELGPSIA
jgi:hypothetical protein